MMTDTLAAALRATVSYMNLDCGTNYILTRERIMSTPVVSVSPATGKGRSLSLVPSNGHVRGSVKESKRGN